MPAIRALYSFRIKNCPFGLDMLQDCRFGTKEEIDFYVLAYVGSIEERENI